MAAIYKMTIDDLLKLKAATLYIITKCGSLDYFRLFKILYFANREHYAEYGRGIVRDTFCALPKGPVPSVLFDAVKIATKQSSPSKGSPLRIISDSLHTPDESYYFILTAKELPDMDELSKSDIKLLDKSIYENQTLDTDTLSEKSHDSAWQEAWDARNSSAMKELSIAKAGGANEAMLDYIRDLEYTDLLLA
jgi:uncharacterized phage-associated protein